MSGAAGQLAAVERMGQPTAVKRLGRSASTPAHTGLAQLAPGLNRKAEEEAARVRRAVITSRIMKAETREDARRLAALTTPVDALMSREAATSAG